MNIAFVTDSTADIPGNYLDQYPIHVVPNILMIKGKSFEDGKEITREAFYRDLPNIKPSPTTGTASIGVYQQLYEKLFQQGFQYIFSIHASKLLSGIYNTAKSAAQSFYERVQVIDSQQLTLGLGFQVLAAAEAAARGASLEMVQKIIEDVRKRARVYAMLDTLEYVRRSGRVSWAKARVSNLLRIKPFIELRYGNVLSLGVTRTRKKGIEQLKKFLLSLGPIERLAILHTNAEMDAIEFLNNITIETPMEPFIVNVNTVIGSHVGPNGLGFATVIK